jgi:hypothetical protein
MSEAINPEAASPSTTQAFEQSDRNPVVNYLGREDADGGHLITPAAGESRVTTEGAAVSPDAGLKY